MIIENLSPNIPYNYLKLKISQSDYSHWLKNNHKRLVKLKKADQNNDTKEEAIDFFLSFQTFYIYFIIHKIDCIPLLNNYDIWSSTINKLLGKHAFLGDLEYLEEKQHINLIVKKIAILFREIRECKEINENTLVEPDNTTNFLSNLEIFSEDFDVSHSEKMNRSPKNYP